MIQTASSFRKRNSLLLDCGYATRFYTRAVAFNMARSPDYIQRYDAVIIDEMHERNKEQVCEDK
jgi:hypothetical protein